MTHGAGLLRRYTPRNDGDTVAVSNGLRRVMTEIPLLSAKASGVIARHEAIQDNACRWIASSLRSSQ
ncbi:MAG: hypothetical protein LBF85_06565 [Tannerella sp.]|nr:hypothetical protein [Tannerella sp.]